MGLMSLFGAGPLSPGKIDKVAKLAANPFAQPDVRMREMMRLFKDGSPAALRGVLKRFASNAQGHIADEDEKKWLEDKLVDVGEAALEPLADYVKTEDKLSYALRTYERIAGTERAVTFFLAVMAEKGPDDYRSAEAKLQIVYQLGDSLDDPRVLPALVPFILDHSDDVRWAVMDFLTRAAEKGALPDAVRDGAAEKLGEIVLQDNAGPRIQRRAAELLADREWSIPGEAEALSPLLDDTFFLDKKRFVRRRVKKPA